MKKLSEQKRFGKSDAIHAGDLLKQQEDDPGYKDRLRRLEQRRIAASDEFREAAGPLLSELASSGYGVGSLSDLARPSQSKGAIPILIKWLPRSANSRVKESIVRALSVPWAKGRVEAALLAEFRGSSDGENLKLKWTIANALEVLATDRIYDDIVELLRDKRHGRAREMLAMALGKMKAPQAVDVLIGLLNDEKVVGHAIIALGKLTAVKARPYLLPFVKHPKVWIRQEAKKALNKIDALT